MDLIQSFCAGRPVTTAGHPVRRPGCKNHAGYAKAPVRKHAYGIDLLEGPNEVLVPG
jgi:hypothetical protein